MPTPVLAGYPRWADPDDPLLALPKVSEALAGREPQRVVARPPRLVNVVV